MSDSLQLFYRDADIFLNNIFLGGFTTMDHHSILELKDLITSAHNLGLEFLENRLSDFSETLEKLYHTKNEPALQKKAIEDFTLLVEYINLSLQELSIYKAEMLYDSNLED